MSVQKRTQPLDLALLFGLGAASQFNLRCVSRRGIEEGIDPNQRVTAVMLALLVVEGFLLDLATLIASFHGTEHPAALAQAIKFSQYRFLDQVGQLLDDETALAGVLVACQPPLAADNELDGKCPTHGILTGSGNRLIVSIGVQTVAIVVHGYQRLQGSTDVIKAHLLSVQRPPGGLDVIFQFLATLTAGVTIAHRYRPDTSCHPTHNTVLRVHTVGEKKRQVGGKIVDRHASSKISFNVSKAISQRQRELGDRVSAGLSDVVARDRDRVEIAHSMIDEILLDITHHAQAEISREKTGVLTLVFFQNIGLHRTADIL